MEILLSALKRFNLIREVEILPWVFGRLIIALGALMLQ